MHRILFSAALAVLTLSLHAQFAIGRWTVDVNDPSRGRTIPSEVFYPATSAGTLTPAAAGDFPVIAFGHGFSMNYDAYGNFWNALVPQGYILIFPKTEIGPVPFPSHPDFALDLIRCTEFLRTEGADASSPLFGAVAPTAAVMGHSMGGGCSFLAAEQFDFDAVAGFAPAETSPTASGAAPQVTEESLIFSGSSDNVTPPASNHQLIHDQLASTCKTFVSIPGGGHCRFADSNIACEFGELTTGGPGSVSRGDMHDITFDLLTPWLDWRLKGQCDRWMAFQDSLATSPRINPQQTCFYDSITVRARWTDTSTVLGCVGDTVDLAAVDGGEDVQWLADGVPFGPNAHVTEATASGDYRFVVSNAFGCSDSSAVRTIDLAAPSVSVTPTGAAAICAGESLVLNASAPTGTTVSWLADGDTVAANALVFVADSTATYRAVAVNGRGCTAISDSFDLTVHPLPVLDSLIVPDSLVTGDTAVLRLAATSALDSVRWQASAGSFLFTFIDSARYRRGAPGTVILEATGFASGCSASVSATLRVVRPADDPPPVDTTGLRDVRSDWFRYDVVTHRVLVGSASGPIVVLDLLGRMVLRSDASVLSLRDLAPGAYVVSDGERAGVVVR